jgi:F-type H+-transporting ATPase subunit b
MRRILIAVGVGVFCLIVGSAWLGSVRAEKEAAGGHHATTDKAGEKGEQGKGEEHPHETPGMLSSDLGVWTFLVFLAVFAILYWKAWPLILEGLQKREHTIQNALDEAKKAQGEAEKLRAQLNQEMSRAQDKVREIIDEGRKHATQMQDEMLNKARADIQADRDRLRRELDTARDQALSEIWTKATDLASLMSAKAIGRQISMDDHRRLFDESLEELTRAGSDIQRMRSGLA